MKPLIRLTLTETKLFLREPMAWMFILGFPPVLMIIFGLIPPFREPQEEFGGARIIDLYAPIMVAIAITVFALSSFPQYFVTYREKGVLRRLRVTPVKPSTMLSAQLLMSLVFALVVSLVILGIARFAFEVALPQNVPGYATAFLLCSTAMFAVGLLVASLMPTGTATGAIGTILLFPMMFFAGLWIPRDAMNDVLRTVSDFTPLGAGVQSLQDATAGDWPQLLHLLVMLAWTVAAGALAVRYFRWE
ncbi:ABC transporter permease [Nesterenkonia rhizosphaerae]|uniref:Transport permease protein n=1 Tax=Nesterenkonia rhizosphaerae TaxID=1348272 RepID=A0ABP9FSJ1_9MICC